MRTMFSILMIFILVAAPLGWVGCDTAHEVTGPDPSTRDQEAAGHRLIFPETGYQLSGNPLSCI